MAFLEDKQPAFYNQIDSSNHNSNSQESLIPPNSVQFSSSSRFPGASVTP